MRTSRDLLRPLAALVVIVATVSLASNVAAFRAATTPAPKATTCQSAAVPLYVEDGYQTPARANCPPPRTPRRATSSGYRSGEASSGGGGYPGGFVVTSTGAS